MMSEVVSDLKDNLAAILSSFREELLKTRTGQVTPAAVENIPVEAYGAEMTLKELAAISVPEPRQLLIEPWDKSVLEDVERALARANLGVSPVVVENRIRLSFPPLTSESREVLVREVGRRASEVKLQVRKARQRARQEAEDFETSEGKDFVFRLEKEIDEIVESVGEEIEEVRRRKEEEIRG